MKVKNGEAHLLCARNVIWSQSMFNQCHRISCKIQGCSRINFVARLEWAESMNCSYKTGSPSVREPATISVIIESLVVQCPHIVFNETILHGWDLCTWIGSPNICEHGQDYSSSNRLLVFCQIFRLCLPNVSVGSKANNWHNTEGDNLVDADCTLVLIVSWQFSCSFCMGEDANVVCLKDSSARGHALV